MNDGIEVHSKKCERCGASVDINTKTPEGYFLCGFCGAKYQEVIEKKENIPTVSVPQKRIKSIQIKQKIKKLKRKINGFMIFIIAVGIGIISCIIVASLIKEWKILWGAGAGIFILLFLGLVYYKISHYPSKPKTKNAAKDRKNEFDKIDRLGITYSKKEEKLNIDDGKNGLQ